jgi:hydrogenase expression/formation protein HypD
MTLKFVDEYRDAGLVKSYAEQIHQIQARPWKLMEVCGGQTHSIIKYGIDKVLPPEITLVHGPGCPVCVTPTSVIDLAIQLALKPQVILCSFGDMLKVPGNHKDLLKAKAEGGDVRIVYSPLDCLKVSRENPDREVVFFAVGFETTAPANAMAAYQAKGLGIRNFSMLVSQVLVPPALEAILSSPDCRIDGFLAPGHVCTIVGYEEYERLSQKYRVPIVVTGFEPVDILQGIIMCVRQLEEGRCQVENQYTRSVNREGNRQALAMISEVFEIQPKLWRGLGRIPASGLKLSPQYREFDAEFRFQLGPELEEEKSECISGLILQGIKKPSECSEFGKGCNPDRPLGAPMVSSEGACAAYFRYRNNASSG